MEEQTIEIPLTVGSRVVLYEDVVWDNSGGKVVDVLYEGDVEKHVPETGLLQMSDGTSKMELLRLLEDAEGYEIIEDE